MAISGWKALPRSITSTKSLILWPSVSASVGDVPRVEISLPSKRLLFRGFGGVPHAVAVRVGRGRIGAERALAGVVEAVAVGVRPRGVAHDGALDEVALPGLIHEDRPAGGLVRVQDSVAIRIHAGRPGVHGLLAAGDDGHEEGCRQGPYQTFPGASGCMVTRHIPS